MCYLSVIQICKNKIFGDRSSLALNTSPKENTISHTAAHLRQT